MQPERAPTPTNLLDEWKEHSLRQAVRAATNLQVHFHHKYVALHIFRHVCKRYLSAAPLMVHKTEKTRCAAVWLTENLFSTKFA